MLCHRQGNNTLSCSVVILQEQIKDNLNMTILCDAEHGIMHANNVSKQRK
jgi:uncharacterized protein YbbC (DUF1343 family)